MFAMAGRPAKGLEDKLRAFELRADGLSNRAIARELNAAPSTVGVWLRDPGLKAAWKSSAQNVSIPAKLTIAPSKVSTDPVRIDAPPAGDLGLNPETEEMVGATLAAGNGEEIAAWSALLRADDVASWREMAAKGIEPYRSAVARIRQRVALAANRLSVLIASGTNGYQARKLVLERMDPAWGLTPEDQASDADRASGLTDEQLDAVVLAGDEKAAKARAAELRATEAEAIAFAAAQ